MTVVLDKNGLNANINCKILEPEIMIKNGFRENKENWYRFSKIIRDISMRITIYKDTNKRPRIDVLDENFGQPYDYQHILIDCPDCEPAILVNIGVESTLQMLTEAGIVTGFVQGEYV